MSKKISDFKKELLIRIALNLENMAEDDLVILELLIDKFELTDPDVKKQIIDLFANKYQIDLTADLNVLVEEQINKAKDDSKIARRKHLRDILMKKFRMLSMIARFCKIADHQHAQRMN